MTANTQPTASETTRDEYRFETIVRVEWVFTDLQEEIVDEECGGADQ